MDIDQTRKRLLSLVATGKERGIAIQYDSSQSILPKLAEKDSWLLKEILPVLLGTTHATVESATLVAQRSPEYGLYKAMILSDVDNSYQNIVLPALEQAIPSGKSIFFTYFLIQYATLYDFVRGAVDAQILPSLTRDGEVVVFPTTFIPWAQGKGYIVPRIFNNYSKLSDQLDSEKLNTNLQIPVTKSKKRYAKSRVQERKREQTRDAADRILKNTPKIKKKDFLARTRSDAGSKNYIRVEAEDVWKVYRKRISQA